MELALYHPGLGFYETAGGAGRSGSDFLTSPEVGPLFGAVLARALDSWWEGLGRPDPFVLVEAGAGQGTLAASILSAAPACSPALRYVLVERSAALRRRLAARLPLEPPSQVLGSAVPTDPEEAPRVEPGLGPLVTAVETLPQGPFAGVVLANELLDNLPFRLLERREEGWADVLVTADLAELAVPAPPEVAAEARALAPSAPLGGRIPIQHAARDWLAEALSRLSRGTVVVVDYASTTGAMAERPWTDWCRTYRGQSRAGHPLEDLGLQDVTCEVAVDQLVAVRPWTSSGDQARFLAAHGLDALVEGARRQWREQAAVGDLAALAALSRVQEAAALTDPSGLGGFQVIEWEVRTGRG